MPSFIIWFILAIIVAQLLPQGAPLFQAIGELARYLIVVSLLLVGASLQLVMIRRAGFKPVLVASLLWVMIATGSLLYLI